MERSPTGSVTATAPCGSARSCGSVLAASARWPRPARLQCSPDRAAIGRCEAVGIVYRPQLDARGRTQRGGDVLRGGIFGWRGQAGGVTAERPPQVKAVDDQGGDGAAAGGDGDHQASVAEDEGDTDAGQDAVDGGNHAPGGEDDVQPALAHAHGLGGRGSGIADGDVGEERKPVGNQATVVAAYLLNRIQVPEVLDTCRDEPDEGEFAENQQCGEYSGGEGNKGGPVWGYEAEGNQSAGHGRQVERRPAHHLASGLSSCTLKHEMLRHESGHERLLLVVVHCSSVHPSGRLTRPSSSALPARATERLAAQSLPVRPDQRVAVWGTGREDTLELSYKTRASCVPRSH